MFNKVSKLFKHFVVLAFSAIVVVTLIQVFMRYVMSAPLKWAEELSRYIFVWSIMVSIGIGIVEEEHIRLNMVTTRFSKKVQLVFFILGQVIVGAFDMVLIIYGGRLAIQNLSVKSPAMQIPIGVAYAGIPVGAVIVLFFLVMSVCREIKKYKTDDLVE